MSGTVSVWYLFHDGQSVPSKVKVDVDADVSDLRDAISDKLHSQRIGVESLSLTLWKPIKELPNGNEAKDVPAGWIREAKGRFDDTVATELKKPQERVNQIIGSGVEQANNSLVRVIVLSKFPELQKRPAEDKDSEGQKRRKLESTGEPLETGNRRKLIIAGHQRVLEELPAPSIAAKKTQLKKYMSEGQPWLNTGQPFGAVGPPVSIYHPVFAEFLKLVVDTDRFPDSDTLDAALELVEESSKFYPNVGKRQKNINKLLARFLEHDIVPTRLSDKSRMICIPCQKVNATVGLVFLEYLEYKSRPIFKCLE
ncbi:hypothetical protein WOLCODRAFT_163835 [Wolfiporia cocos MD-104 SS10]|uniref:Uncharacterized protein n=1 Tax=Wolfiporia cocos (strain MD-104) TaxID=742152 RepID=A0A2H3JJX9_WOLCO|nr:hypothetical protein WOLCODRAFT_163835 [Wolfiporia cocos MD-104 SS10]